MNDAAGVDPADPESGEIFTGWGARLFGAPVMAVICMNRGLYAFLDIRLLVHTICVAAQGYGLDSIIAMAFVNQPDILRKELEIPENLHIVTGAGLGHAHPKNIINSCRSPRRPVEEVVRYKG
ncbi:MAG TPA: nitroreductase family protein [Anaerolineales bacterium]|nr:nitroreductase family protein [Anaerolineales bacterium]